ncbi:MAG: hypothetical protein IT529_20780 [Burkholderiales bacterium]|nr:hypothetical protein [Burkholderiales bacterium]
MSSDHRDIMEALKALLAAARGEEKGECAGSIEHLIRHSVTEEPVTCPAAILAGRYLRMNPGRGAG